MSRPLVGTMTRARQNFEESYGEPIMFALELVDRVRTAVAEAIDQKGPSEDGEYEDEIGTKAWKEVVSDPSVKKKFVELARNWCNVDASSIQL